MRQRRTASQKILHPALIGLPSGLDETGRLDVLQDHTKPKRNPNPKKPRDPKPGSRRDPHPIQHPEIHPPQNRRCPCLKKRDEKNEHREDDSDKPGFNYSDWHKTGHHALEEHLVCGYEKSGNNISQLILGTESDNGAIRYTGHVPLGEHPLDELIIASQSKTDTHPFSTMAFMSDNPAVWLKPSLACLVECSEKTDCGLLMTPVYRGLKADRPLKTRSATGLMATAIQ
ncbi:MAG: hypothetical protein GX776_01830 [Oxalobacter sp.]|nr:hypothetical protein [Oxalobacter sp.]